MRTGTAAQRERPRPTTLLVGAAIVAALGLSFAWDEGVMVAALAAAYLLFLASVAQAAREGRDGTAFATAAVAIGVVGALSVPLTWGWSLAFAPVGLPLAVPGLRSSGRTRWLAAIALVLNAALTALFVMIWFA